MPKFSWRGEEQWSKSPSSLLFEPISPSSFTSLFLPPPYFFPLLLPSPNFFWAISPSSLFCSSSPLFLVTYIISYWLLHGELWVISVLCAANNGFFLLHMELKLPKLLMEHTIHKSRQSKLTADIILNWPFSIYLNSA